MGRKAFGPSKKKACDTRRDCRKKKLGSETKAGDIFSHHPRAFESKGLEENV
jgi:hypothetical protein